MGMKAEPRGTVGVTSVRAAIIPRGEATVTSDAVSIPSGAA